MVISFAVTVSKFNWTAILQTKNIEIEFESCFVNFIFPDLDLDDIELFRRYCVENLLQKTNALEQALPEHKQNM